MHDRWTLIAAGGLGVTGVAIGAFAAHGLENWLSKQNIAPEAIATRLQQCDVAVRYQLLHALAVLAVGLSNMRHERPAKMAVLFWLLGILLFSGGLYSMTFTAVIGHWAIVPSGGLCLLLGWGAVIILGLSFGGQSRPSRIPSENP